MDSLSNQELISKVTLQADQITRYESRLRDIVAAYKFLAKEKEVLETSLEALTNNECSNENSDNSLSALKISLCTMTAEKNRIEEAFQADKKVTREKYENLIADLRLEIRNLKAKVTYEAQEREKDRADQNATIRELHNKLTSAMKDKEELEETVNRNINESNCFQTELKKRIQTLSDLLEESENRLQAAENLPMKTQEQIIMLEEKLALAEQSYLVAIHNEQIKTKHAEETARNICSSHEEKVAHLEEKVAELTKTIGYFELRKEKDVKLIKLLKKSMNRQILENISSGHENPITNSRSETDSEKLADREYLQILIDKLYILKNEIIAENAKLENPLDISTILKIDCDERIVKFRDDYEKLKLEFESYILQNSKVSNDDIIRLQTDIEELKHETVVLKQAVEIYKFMLYEERQDKNQILHVYEEKLNSKQEYNEKTVMELKSQLEMSEKELSKQRSRYEELLEETNKLVCINEQKQDTTMQPKEQKSSPPLILHYTEELARKDSYISLLRQEKQAFERQYKDCKREVQIEKDKMKNIVETLTEENKKLQRMQPCEDINLEYLKNVLMAYLMSSDCTSSRYMLNAIASVLKISKKELAMLRKPYTTLFYPRLLLFNTVQLLTRPGKNPRIQVLQKQLLC